MGAGCPGEMPTDQRVDDALSLVFDTESLAEPLEVLGAAELDLLLASDKPRAQIGVRLCDVAPDGSSLRVSYQVLNLTHRDSHAEPTPLEPGRKYRIRVKFNDCGHRFAAGHRLRVAISTGYWPMVWPAAENATLALVTGESRLVLPVRKPRAGDGETPFSEPESAPRARTTRMSEGRIERRFSYDPVQERALYLTDADGGVFGEGMMRFDEIGTAQDHALKRELSIRPNDPLSATYKLTSRYVMQRPGWDIRIEVLCTMTSDADTFFLSGELEALEGGRSVVRRTWREEIARDLI